MRRIWWLAVAAGLVGCAGTETAVPESLRFPAGESAVLRVTAAGAQVYECKASAQDASDWVLVAPDAQLYATGSTVMGKHYGGPTWEALDGSTVVGELRARADAPDPNAIPWLLLRAKSTSGSGVFSRVTSIQRINTVGGKAPAGCGSAELGHTLRVSYSAVYVFSDAR
jgi:Protein of unknown function (DUF3455)